MKAKTFNISVAPGLVDLIDQEAKIRYMSRSEYIRRAVIKQLRKDGAFASSSDSVEDIVKRDRLARLKKLVIEKKKNPTEDIY